MARVRCITEMGMGVNLQAVTSPVRQASRNNETCCTNSVGYWYSDP
jgi:hypothetical protein